MTTPFKVAFSLLDQDRPFAELVSAATGLGSQAFLYSEQQAALLVAGDGIDAFTSIFRTARVCVVLWRTGWGDTKWTRIEERIIKERYLDEGLSFLLLVRMDTLPIPDWFPRHHIWADANRDGVAGVARAAVERLSGSTTTPPSIITRLSAERRPIPLARYQRQRLRTSSSGVTFEPAVCDGCSESVQYRVLTSMSLPASEFGPEVHERLCPKCVRDRGSRASSYPIPPSIRGLTDITLGDRDPSFAEFVNYFLIILGNTYAKRDADLQALGIDRIQVEGVGSRSILKTIRYFEVNAERLRSQVTGDGDLWTAIKRQLMQRYGSGL